MVSTDGSRVDRTMLVEIQRYLMDAVVSDISARPPALIIVDTRRDKPYFGGMEFDYIDFFKTDPRFAEIWRHYERLDDYEGFAVFIHRNGH